MPRRPLTARYAAVTILCLGAALTACAPKSNSTAKPAGAGGTSTAANAASCTPGKLPLYKSGQLTVGTDKPAYSPWFEGNDPTNGKGFESAVAYAVAKHLGFTKQQVTWTVVPFNSSYAPGPKKFDFDINQISITPQRERGASFSIGYYTVNQAIVTLDSSPIAKASTISALKDAKLGAQVGTTSLAAVQHVVKPSVAPLVYNDTNDAKNALINGQVQGIVADVPTAIYLTSAVIPHSKVIGQFDYSASGTPEQFGLLFDKGSKLVPCANRALEEMKSSGELAALQKEWLPAADKAPRLKP